jgi:glycosyltransferase involved in cell wall biosynthesis
MRGQKTGIGVYTQHLIRALNEFAPHVQTIQLDDGAAVAQRTDKRIWREQFALPQLARKANADLLHLTGFAAPLRSRVPVVLTVMDLIGVLFSENFPPASRFYWSRYLPFTLRAARHIITLSENTKRDVMRLTRVPAEHLTVIPPGVDARFHQREDTARLKETRARLQLPARYFLFVSTLEPRKGVDTLINAYAKIAAQVDEHLVIVGKRGWYYDNFFAQTRALHLDTRVHFLDYISDDDLPWVYNLAVAFVFPSRYEGFGLTPLEAMACGIPVISSNAAALPEVIGDAGILVEPEDANGFARAMRAVSENQLRQRELREKGLQRAKNYLWQKSALEVADLYLQLLPNRKSKIENRKF